jgi:hypothetical protein
MGTTVAPLVCRGLRTLNAPNLLTRKQLALIGRREWRLDNLYRIVNETGQNVPFARNDVQRAMWASCTTGTSSSKAGSTASRLSSCS